MSTCLKVLHSEGALVFFPEGTRAPAGGYLVPKFGVGWVLYKTQASVVPIYLHGTGNAKAFSGTRPNLELIVGTPVPASEIIGDLPDNRDGYQQIADRILERIRILSLQTTISKVESPGEIHDRNIIDDERLR